MIDTDSLAMPKDSEMNAIDKSLETFSFRAFLIFLILAVGACFYLILPYIVALAMGIILSLLTRPIYAWIVAKGLESRVAAVLTTVLIALVFVVPLGIFSFLAVKQAMVLASSVGAIDPSRFVEMSRQMLEYPGLSFLQDHMVELQYQGIEVLKSGGGYLAAESLDFAKNLPANLLKVFLACLSCLFFLKDGPSLSSWLNSKIPLDKDVRSVVASSFRDTAISVVWASMAAAGAQCVVMFFAFIVLGVPGAFIAAGATFILSWIPLLGSTPVFITGMGLLAMDGDYMRAAFMLVFGLVAGVVDNFVRPIVLKGRGEMHPLVSLVAIFGGLKLFGFFGVFFGPILAAIAITLLNIWPIVAKRHGLLY